jgi:hypothetical protein
LNETGLVAAAPAFRLILLAIGGASVETQMPSKALPDWL